MSLPIRKPSADQVIEDFAKRIRRLEAVPPGSGFGEGCELSCTQSLSIPETLEWSVVQDDWGFFLVNIPSGLDGVYSISLPWAVGGE
jgi:hypothetical protein